MLLGNITHDFLTHLVPISTKYSRSFYILPEKLLTILLIGLVLLFPLFYIAIISAKLQLKFYSQIGDLTVFVKYNTNEVFRRV